MGPSSKNPNAVTALVPGSVVFLLPTNEKQTHRVPFVEIKSFVLSVFCTIYRGWGEIGERAMTMTMKVSKCIQSPPYAHIMYVKLLVIFDVITNVCVVP